MSKTTWGRSFLSVLVSMALLPGLACQSGGTKGDKGSGGSAGAAPGVDGGLGGAGKAGSSGMAGAKAGSGGSDSSANTCYVDFPCRTAYRCVGSDRYVAQVTIGCKDICPPGPCSGAMCQDSGSPNACPAGTRCVATDGFDYVDMGCKAIPDAGVGDTRLKDPADAPAGETGSVDAQSPDRAYKQPLDGVDVPGRKADAFVPDVTPICVEGEHRCKDDKVLEECYGGRSWLPRGCDFACRDNACVGECQPGLRRRCRSTGNVPQACTSDSTWADEAACSGSTPYCATGECVATCLNEGQDCTAANTACCAGTECVAANGGNDIQTGTTKAECKAVPACAALGAACAANTDCCAGLDCTAGKCVAKQTACQDAPADGVCGGTSGATCCPGTLCSTKYSPNDPLGCVVKTKPQEYSCPREQPAFHEACRAALLGLECTYTDWVKWPGAFFTCTCSYRGWSCVRGQYVH